MPYYNACRFEQRRSGITRIVVNPAWRFLLAIFGVWLLLYGSYALSRPPLPDGFGTMHAEIAREMVMRNDWSHTFANGVPVPSSSKALDESMAASFKLFGIADWSARLPIALSVLGTAITVFFFGRALFVWNAAGLYAGLFFLTFPVTFLTTRDLTEVPILCLATTVFSFALWHLLVVRRLTGWNAIGVTATACLVVLLAANWPGMLLPLWIAALCWAVRRLAVSTRQAPWFLIGWAAGAYLLAALLGRRAYGGMTALGAMPPLALLLGGWLAEHEAFSDRKSLRLAYTIFVLCLIAAAGALLFAFHGSPALPAHSATEQAAVRMARIPYFVAAAALVAGASGHLFFRLRQKIRIAYCFLAGTLAGLIIAVQVALVIASPRTSSEILADAIRPELNPTDLVVIDGRYPEASSFAFYLEHTVLIALPPGVLKPGLLQASPHGTVAVDQAWNGTQRVYLWTRSDRPLSIRGKSFVIAASGGKEILSNQPNAAGAAF